MKMGRGSKDARVEPVTRRCCSRSVHHEPSTSVNAAARERRPHLKDALDSGKERQRAHRSPRVQWKMPTTSTPSLAVALILFSGSESDSKRWS